MADEKSLVFRFDDISVNTDISAATVLGELLRNKTGAEIWWCISPLVSRRCSHDGRVFPREWNALSDWKGFYNVDRLGTVTAPSWARVASHGLIHVDHRLMPHAAQELSIVVSCRLLGADVFVPPFNKWNHATETVCWEHGIRLVKFEDGWRSAEHNEHDTGQRLWYLHPRRWDTGKLERWLQCE